MRFCSVEMGSFYLDIIKDRRTPPKRTVWRVVAARLRCITSQKRWCAGWHRYLSFTADEVWGYLPGEREKYVFTGEWYEGLFGLADSEAMERYLVLGRAVESAWRSEQSH
ncbi:hypothetical protein ACVXG9_16460 [Escherichia coli]